MPELIPVLSKNDIDSLVAHVAQRISSDYQHHDLVLIGVLKGAFVFLSDLIRRMDVPVQIDFIRTFSYGSGDCSSEDIRLTKDIEVDIENKDVLLVEDIVDTGLTLKYLIDYLKSYHPKTIKVCALIDKQERRKINVAIDYSCHDSAEGFLVGYGLDYNEDYRYLSGIYRLQL
ncbi:MAG: hypoxanthine phosphoribosyltransferase [Desulfobacterales bacterium]